MPLTLTESFSARHVAAEKSVVNIDTAGVETVVVAAADATLRHYVIGFWLRFGAAEVATFLSAATVLATLNLDAVATEHVPYVEGQYLFECVGGEQLGLANAGGAQISGWIEILSVPVS